MSARPPTTTATTVATVLPTAGATTRSGPLSATDVAVTGGFWADRLATNHRATIPAGFAQLQAAGTLHNFKLAAGSVAAGDGYRALGIMFDKPFPFLDSDVYKWLEGAGWELGRQPDPAIAAMADEAIGLIEAAQRPDGYLNTFVQVLAPGTEYRDLAWGHELYCIGHLLQAAIAWHRALGDDRLLLVAERAVDSIERELGPDGREAIDGHPEIEMALVELYRTTAERRYLDLAATFIRRRGHGLLGPGRFGTAYWQDHQPVAEATSVAGHAVRQLYLDAGAVDVAVELGDHALFDAAHRRWRDMVETRVYLTGAVGSRHKDEAFGDPFELPPDRAYAETCAAIASVMLAWRLLLATGDPACADLMERTLYNAVLPSLSRDGTRFFYVNPLQRRTHRAWAEAGVGERASWYACACCPPNLMRTIASFPQVIATRDADGVQVHQFAAAEVTADVPGGRAGLAVSTDYPWDGRVEVAIRQTPADPWTLTVRVPAWASGATVRLPGGEPRVVDGPAVIERRAWVIGDTVTLDLAMAPRITTPDPRVDAVRGTIALERGPLVYAIETADMPSGTELEEVALDPSAAVAPVPRPDIGEGVVGLTVTAAVPSGAEIGAIPYFAWGGRAPEAMRVWIPETSATPATPATSSR
jgi:DUF1680 family protein